MKNENGYKLIVTGCSDCPLNEYVGGPEQCAVTNLETNGKGTMEAWASCPLKKNNVIISLEK